MIRFAEFKKEKIRYSDRGKEKVIILLHGFLESLEIWDDFSEKLSKQFRVIAIDLPGHGQTPCIGYIHSMEMMAECVKAVADYLNLRRYVIIGHSMGGYTALAFAKLFPENVAGICLFHSTALPDSEEKKKDRDRVAEIVKNNHTQFISELIPKLFSQESLEILKEKVAVAKQIALKTHKEGIVAALKGMKERPSTELVLKNSDYPVLFIIGKKDTLLAWENLLLLTSLPKKSYHVVLEHAGHMGFYEAPEETYKTINKFSRICFKEKIRKK